MRFKQIVFLLTLVLFATLTYSQSDKYQIDTKDMQKRKIERKRERLTREEKTVMRIEKKQASDKRKEEHRSYRLHKKAVKEHNRKINGNSRNIITGKKVYKQMKSSKREAKRRNKSKNPIPWYKRIF